MILLFGEKAKQQSLLSPSHSVSKSKSKNNPVENSGILALDVNTVRMIMAMGGYDEFISSNPYVVDYASYYDGSNVDVSSDFMGGFAAAIATLGDSGFSSGGGFDCGGSSSFSGGSCGSFCSVG